MANMLAEMIQMNFFFPDTKSRKAQRVAKDLFVLDMQFDLLTGSVKLATSHFFKKNEEKVKQTQKFKVSALISQIEGCYNNPKGQCSDVTNQRTILKLFEEFRFMKTDKFEKEYSDQDKLWLISRTKIMKF